MKTNQRGFANIILVILIIALVGALAYTMLPRQPIPAQQSQSNNTQATASPVSNSQIFASSSQGSKPGWRKYTDIAFEVQYPEDTFALVQVTTQYLGDNKKYSGVKLIFLSDIDNLGQQYNDPNSCKILTYTADTSLGVAFVVVNASTQALTSSFDTSLKT